MPAARLLAFLVFVAIVGLSALMIYRPGTVLGVDDEALAHSLREEIGVGEVPVECEGGDERRLCVVGAAGRGSARVVYSVTTADRGCWDAERKLPRSGSGAPAAPSGCLTILDVVRVL